MYINSKDTMAFKINVQIQDDTPTESKSDSGAPLSSLAGNPYKGGSYVYPSDLFGRNKGGHTVCIAITDAKVIGIDEAVSVLAAGETLARNTSAAEVVDVADKVFSAAGSAVSNAWNAAKASDTLTGAGVAFGESLSKQINNSEAISKTASIIQKNATIMPGAEPAPKDYIYLSIPDSMHFDYNAHYDNPSGSSAAFALASHVPLIGRLTNAIQSAIKNDVLRMAASKSGYVFNPQEQLLFESITFREYSLSFTFLPRSPEEAQTIKNIITSLRRAAAPSIGPGLAGFFFTAPSYVDVSFLFDGQTNPNINRIARSVLTQVSVDYAPNGWSSTVDGAPTQTTVTLNLKETVLVDRNKILEGY
jgi:hypothetical protein